MENVFSGVNVNGKVLDIQATYDISGNNIAEEFSNVYTAISSVLPEKPEFDISKEYVLSYTLNEASADYKLAWVEKINEEYTLADDTGY